MPTPNPSQMSSLFTRSLLPLILATVLSGCASTPDSTKKSVKIDGINISEAKANSAAGIYAELGLRYMQKGKYKLAIQKLRKAIELDPELPSAYLYLGQLYYQLDEIADAEVNYRKAISMDPGYSRAQNNFGAFLCEQKRYAEAETQFLAAIDNPLYENSAATLENIGLCLYADGQIAKAEDYFKQALAEVPYLGRSLYLLAKINFDRGDLKAAELNLERYRRVASQTPETLWLGIQVARKVGNKNREASLTLLLEKQFPSSAQAQLLINPGSKAGAS